MNFSRVYLTPLSPLSPSPFSLSPSPSLSLSLPLSLSPSTHLPFSISLSFLLAHSSIQALLHKIITHPHKRTNTPTLTNTRILLSLPFYPINAQHASLSISNIFYLLTLSQTHTQASERLNSHLPFTLISFLSIFFQESENGRFSGSGNLLRRLNWLVYGLINIRLNGINFAHKKSQNGLRKKIFSLPRLW